jgi:hypothetical protein
MQQLGADKLVTGITQIWKLKDLMSLFVVLSLPVHLKYYAILES